MERDKLNSAESRDPVLLIRRESAGFEYSPHSFRYSTHSATNSSAPMQIAEERVPEWELPRSYPLNCRTSQIDYLPRRQQQPQTTPSTHIQNPAEDWRPNKEPSDATPDTKYRREICVMLLSKVALCLEVLKPRLTTVQELMDMILQDNQELSLPVSARDVFSLWLISPMIELQLTPSQRPYQIRQQWADLLLKYTSAGTKHLDRDEPELCLRRNVFFDKQEEMRICDVKILELLYEEAKYNVLKGRYPCDIQDCDVLSGIQAHLDLGPFNPQTHTAEYFRSKIREYYPSYACKGRWSLLAASVKPGPEHRLLDRYRNIASNTTRYKLLRKYMEFVWALPYYGSAFFSGQIERPTKGFSALFDHYDCKVLIGINREGIHVIDKNDNTLLLSIKFKNLSWDYSVPCDLENPDCLPCLYVQFTIPGQITRNTKLIQIFSRQANIMDQLISKFVDDLKQKPSWSDDQLDGYLTSTHDDGIVPISAQRLTSRSSMEEKMKRLTITTLNEAGKPVNFSKVFP